MKEPIFKEWEANGCYNASLSTILDNGTKIHNETQLDIVSFRNAEIQRCLKLEFDTITTNVRIEQYIKGIKNKCISDLHKDFNNHVNLYETKDNPKK